MDAGLGAGQPARRVTVDGEVFDVSLSTEHPGQYHFTWLSGPKRPQGGYGFGTRRSDGGALSEHDIQALIRDFLMQVNPDTGYID